MTRIIQRFIFQLPTRCDSDSRGGVVCLVCVEVATGNLLCSLSVSLSLFLYSGLVFEHIPGWRRGALMSTLSPGLSCQQESVLQNALETSSNLTAVSSFYILKYIYKYMSEYIHMYRLWLWVWIFYSDMEGLFIKKREKKIYGSERLRRWLRHCLSSEMLKQMLTLLECNA